jgi:hypothetical protein
MADELLYGNEAMAKAVFMGTRHFQRFIPQLREAKIVFRRRKWPRHRPYNCALKSYLIEFMLREGFYKGPQKKVR